MDRINQQDRVVAIVAMVLSVVVAQAKLDFAQAVIQLVLGR